ncbi:unnamed protein product, partial [Symbiodinium necroappetens]
RVVRLAKDWWTPTWIIKLDVKKAFDSVSQEDRVAQRHSGGPWEARAWLSLLEARGLNLAIGGAFMDDTYLWSLWGYDKAHLQCALASLERRLRAHGLVINPSKTAVIFSQEEGGGSFTIGGEQVHCLPFGTVITALGSPITFGESVAAIVTEMNHRARKAFHKNSRLLCAPTPLKRRTTLHQGLVRGAALWGGQAWPITDAILRAINSTQLQQIRRGARVALQQSKVLRWSTFQLQHTWELYGDMARSKHGGRDMLLWRNLQWWEAEKNKPKRQRATRAHRYNAFVDPERQLVHIATLEWMQVAQDRQRWATLAAAFVQQYDVPWATGHRRSRTATEAAATQQPDRTLRGTINVLNIHPGRGANPLTAPPELPIAPGVTLHMRALPFGVWAGITMPDRATHGPDYGPQPARSYARARQHIQPTQPLPNAYIGVHTAFTLLPWGDLVAGAPDRWLMVITAVGRHVDTDGAELHPGEAYLLSWDTAAARWQPSSLPRKVAHQYYYDWGRQQGTHPIQQPYPPGETYPLGQWEQMAMNFIPNPANTHRFDARGGGPDHPSFMQRRDIASTQLDSQVGQASHGEGRPVQALPQEVAQMLRWLRELAAWGEERQMPMPLRYELESAIAVFEDGLQKDNSVRAARLRLLDLWHEEDEVNGFNQHQLYEDLRVALQLLREGNSHFHQATAGQGGNLLRHGTVGLQQAIAAVQEAQALTMEGDLDWCSGSWGAAVGVLLEDAEQAVDEAVETNYVHCSDVLALYSGGDEAPQRPQDHQARLEAILGDIRRSLGFLTARQHAQVLNILAMMAMWQTQQGADLVDTQTTDEGDEKNQLAERARSSWQPPLGAEHWLGSLPSSGDNGRDERSTEDEGGPTDADLINAMEEYERRQAEEAAEQAEREATSLFTWRRTEGGTSSHRRRRMHSVFEGAP